MAKKKENAYEMKLKAQLAETIGDGADGMQTDDIGCQSRRHKEFVKWSSCRTWLFMLDARTKACRALGRKDL